MQLSVSSSLFKAGNAAQGAAQKMGFVKSRGSAGGLLKLPWIHVKMTAHVLRAFSTIFS